MSGTSSRSKAAVEEQNELNKSLVGRILRRGSGSNSTLANKQLEDVVDVERNLELYDTHQKNVINPKTLYKTGPFNINTQLIKAQREEELSVTGNAVTLPLFSKEFLSLIKQSPKRLIHLGMIVLGIKGLARKELGTKVLLLLLDKSWTKDAKKAYIAGIEVDMNQNTGLFYCSPQLLKSKTDISNIQIGIQTKGYNNYKGNNLLLKIGVLGRMTNSSSTQYKLQIDGIMEAVQSRGIKLIKPMPISANDLAGYEWELDRHLDGNEASVVPNNAVIYQNLQGQTQIRFVNYHDTPINQQETEEDNESVILAELNQTERALMVNYERFNIIDFSDDERDDDYFVKNPYEDSDEYSDNEYESESDDEFFDTQEEFALNEFLTFKNSQKEPKTMAEIRNKQFTVKELQDQVDDMIIEALNYTKLDLNQIDKEIKDYFNVEMIEEIQQGKKPLQSFFKQEKSRVLMADEPMSSQDKRTKPDMSFDPLPDRKIKIETRPTWIQPDRPYQDLGKFVNMGRRKPIEILGDDDSLLMLEKYPPQMWPDEILIWEQRASRKWQIHGPKNNMDMIAFMETTLGPTALGFWQSIKETKPDQVSQIRNYGNNPYNFTALLRTHILGVDPSRDNTYLQNMHIRTLEQLSISDLGYINEFTNDFMSAICQAGKALDDNLADKYLSKLPGSIGIEIQKEWDRQFHNKTGLGIGPRITFAYDFLYKKCIQQEVEQQVKRQSSQFCRRAIFTPQQYDKQRPKRKFLKKSRNPRRTSFKDKRLTVRKPSKRKCACFICGDPNHFANKCPNRNQDNARSAITAQIDEAIVSASDSEGSIYSIFSDEEITQEFVFLTQEQRDDRYITITDCDHAWLYEHGTLSVPCIICDNFPDLQRRYQCGYCSRQICHICVKYYFNINTNIRGQVISSGFSTDLNFIAERVSKHETQIKLLINQNEQLQKRIEELEQILQNKQEPQNISPEEYFSTSDKEEQAQIRQAEYESLLSERQRKGKDIISSETPEEIQPSIVCFGKLQFRETGFKASDDDELLQPDKEVFKIPLLPTSLITAKARLWVSNNKYIPLNCIFDTGCSVNLIPEKFIPKLYRTKLPIPAITTTIEERPLDIKEYIPEASIQFQDFSGQYRYKYWLPKIHILPASIPSNSFLIGLNFMFSLSGTITLSRHSITLSKHANTFPTLRYQLQSELSTKRGGQGELDFFKFHENPKQDNCFITHDTQNCSEDINRFIDEQIRRTGSYTLKVSTPGLTYEKYVSKLEQKGFIGDDVTKNRVNYEFDLPILNPNVTIRTANMEYSVTDREEFKKQIKEMIDQNLIKRSTSPHRSAAFVVRNHAEIKRGKARIVYNYKRLNDNTLDDAYCIPNKDELINMIQGKTIFSKLDCKSGYHQIKMKEKDKPWTAFTCPEGHFEWNVLSFGLKNAPAIFQRFMDSCFKDFDFVYVYIDDILIASSNALEHDKHLKMVLKRIEEKGIVISRKKLELFQKTVSFLGLKIGKGRIELQEHIVKKALEFPDKLEDKKTLQSFLGLINYARKFIPNLGKMAAPLYSKLGKSGQRFFNQQDIIQVQKIKEAIQNIKPLELPLESDYKVVEVDSCNEGWGAILITKPTEYSPKAEEKISAYASGTFSKSGSNWTSLDYEIQGVIKAIDHFRLYLQKPFLVRTDCEAIVRFLANENSRKQNNRRWLNLRNIIDGNGYKVKFEYIKGKQNVAADLLSRKTSNNE